MKLSEKRIVLFAEQQYQDIEVWYPFFRLREEGAEITIVGSGTAVEYYGKYGYPVRVDKNIDEVRAEDFDGLVIPGGFAPDYMRRSEKMIQFVRTMHAQGKIIASICHGAWMLASAEILSGKKATSFFAIKSDIIHAGALWHDAEVVRDGNLITARKPEDLPAFCRTIIDALSEQ